MSQLKLRVLDTFNGYIIDSDEPEAEFTLKNGKWSVKYVREKTLNNGGIEVDGPVEVESDEVEILEVEFKSLTHA